MKKVYFLVVMMLISAGLLAQVTIAVQDFDAGTSMSFVNTNGSTQTGSSGAGDRPASSTFYTNATTAWKATNETSTLTFGNVTGLGSYVSKYFEFRLASWSIASTGNGADAGDIVTVAVSLDNGGTYSNEVRVLGNTNAYWHYSTGTGNAFVTYDGNNVPTDFAPAAGGNRTTDGYSTLRVNLADATTQARIRITMLNNSANEYWTIDEVKLVGTASGTPDIALSSPTPAVPAGNMQQGSSNNVVYRFDLAVTTASATLSGVTVTTAAGYAAADLVNLKCWHSADATFNSGSDQLLSTKTTGLGPGAQVFPSFTNQLISSGATGYIFITADIACTASTLNSLTVNAITTADISFLSGNKSGSASAGGAQAITAGTPNNASGLGATNANAQSSVSWTNPTGCYDEIMIVAAATTNNTGIPSGDGTAYTANLAYGSGTALGNGFVVYKGSTSPQVVTALTNGTTYFFKIFTRLGTVWSSGVETSATPNAVSSATDFFRSAGTGTWNTNGSWETSADGSTNWIAATLTPTTTSSGITIKNGHNITISAAGVSVDQTIIESGGQLTIASTITWTLANGTGTDLDIQGTLLNQGGTWTINASAGWQLSNGGTYIHNTTAGIATPLNAATIQNTSTFIYRGNSGLIPSASFSSRTYGHLRLESSSGALSIAPSIGAGNSCTTNDFFIGSNVTLNCASLNATSAFNVSGNLTTNGTIDNSVGFFNTNLSGASKTLGGSTVPNLDDVVIVSPGSYTLTSNSALSFSTSSLTIQPGASLNASTFQLTGPGTADINGTLISAHSNGIGTSGTLANTGTKTLGAASTINFAAAGPQVLNTRSDYANLTVSGGGTKTTDGNVTMSGVLNLTSGLVVLGSNNFIMTNNSPAGAIASYSGSSYIVTNGSGALRRAVSGAGTYTFPVGILNNLQEASVNFTAPLGAANTLAAQFVFGIGGNNGLPVSESGDNITRTSVIGFWEINPGAAFADLYTGTFIAKGFGDIIDYSKTHLLKRTNGAAPWTLDGTHVPTTGSNALATLQRTGMSGFSQFGVGGESNIALPVTLLSFSGYKDGSRNQLRWTTATELNNLGFEVQRSTDGVSYTAIGFVNSLAQAGNSNEQISYGFTDQSPAGARQYYRLRQVDLNNQGRMSNIVLIRGSKPLIATIDGMFPNPAASYLNVLISAPGKEQVSLVVIDMTGKILSRQTAMVETGSNTIRVDLSKLASGAYTLRLISADAAQSTGKFIKQ